MNIAEWRKSHGITQDQLAEAVGSSRPHISKVERGAAEPSPDLARRIEAHTRGKVTAASLLGVAASPRRRGVREESALYEPNTLTVEVHVPSQQQRDLRDLGIDIEAVAKEGAKRAISEAHAAAWREANRDAIAAYNKWIAKHGTLAEQLGLI